MTNRPSGSLMAVLIRIGLLFALAIMMMAENAQAQSALTAAAPLAQANPLPRSANPLNEEELRARFVGKTVFLRGCYLGDTLNFDANGKITGSPMAGSFTLSAFEVRSLTLSKQKLTLEADRYGLHFRGALPFENEGAAYDRVMISSKPVKISIEREAIPVPKKKKDQPTPPGLTAHSDLALNAALDNVFAPDLSPDLDPRMTAQLPVPWQGYFASRQQGRLFMPADSNIKLLADGITPPRVLNRIDPSSNEFAQQFGIAGMAMLRTVVDATGVPRQIAIARPIGFGLDERAVDAVRNSRFAPALAHGQPVPVVIDLVVTFRIYSNVTKAGSGSGSGAGSVTKDGKGSTLAAAMTDGDTTR